MAGSIPAMRAGVTAPRDHKAYGISFGLLGGYLLSYYALDKSGKQSGVTSRSIMPIPSIAAPSFLSRRFKYSVSVLSYSNIFILLF